jgi:DNA-binding XRE family transcriptional regulator
MNNDNIIYGLKDPRTDEIKYVGKSMQGIKRAKSHLVHSHNPLVNEWINELKMDNYLPDVIILENVLNWTELLDKEKYWIGKLLDEDFDLFNILSTNSYDNNIDNYNKKLKEQIKNREKLLQNKLSKVMAQGGNISDISGLIKSRRKMLNINQENLAEISNVGLRTIKGIESRTYNTTLNTLLEKTANFSIEETLIFLANEYKGKVVKW